MEQKEKDLKKGGRCAIIAIIVIAAAVIHLWQVGKNHRESLPPAQQCLSAWDDSHAQMARIDLIMNMLIFFSKKLCNFLRKKLIAHTFA